MLHRSKERVQLGQMCALIDLLLFDRLDDGGEMVLEILRGDEDWHLAKSFQCYLSKCRALYLPLKPRLTSLASDVVEEE